MSLRTSNDGRVSDDRSSSTAKVDESPVVNDSGITGDVEKTSDQTIPELVTVPRSERRGLFGRFTIVAEVTQPKDYSRSIKYLITVLVALAGVAAPMGSTIILRKSKVSLDRGIDQC